ncbi:unnamed protein product [Caenorhabditis sp. 36 PRJEB53466]|nr:unnamed protein product [Caenorhabditis sp. 36 PRJEB53466]
MYNFVVRCHVPGPYLPQRSLQSRRIDALTMLYQSLKIGWIIGWTYLFLFFFGLMQEATENCGLECGQCAINVTQIRENMNKTYYGYYWIHCLDLFTWVYIDWAFKSLFENKDASVFVKRLNRLFVIKGILLLIQMVEFFHLNGCADITFLHMFFSKKCVIPLEFTFAALFVFLRICFFFAYFIVSIVIIKFFVKYRRLTKTGAVGETPNNAVLLEVAKTEKNTDSEMGKGTPIEPEVMDNANPAGKEENKGNKMDC